jgi:hypothetical protein
MRMQNNGYQQVLRLRVIDYLAEVYLFCWFLTFGAARVEE